MIDDPLPADWRELQEGVRRIFRNVGLSAEVEVDVATPRGSVNVDVVAVDLRSVDKIKYNVECKNWGTAIPQAVVHSFTTVMHETGANIGFIISKHGLQQGAKEYTKNTNITGLTYLEFQQRYFEAWWRRYFCPRIGDAADRPLQYVEEFNQRRDRAYEQLSPEKQKKFDQLRAIHQTPVQVFSMFNYHVLAPMLDTGTLLNIPTDVDEFKKRVLEVVTPLIVWHGETFRDVLEGILEYLSDVEDEFAKVFGGYIFDFIPISGVTPEGPPLEDAPYNRGAAGRLPAADDQG